ncbi:hypothetical protein DFH09DRAFT_1087992 [Mycena vulgaris]|nr:hypothetical protein DFH09DRAFT_1087992 [Mycena vulgaris]
MSVTSWAKHRVLSINPMISLLAWAPRGIWRPFPLRNRCSSIRHYSGEASPDSPQRKYKRTVRAVSTLNPSLLSPADHLDLSQSAAPKIRSAPARGGTRLAYAHHRPDLSEAKTETIPFPAHARGFLYYHFPPGTTSLEGGLRFRCITGNSPSSFPRGHDLLGTSGFPWQISLPQLACRPGYAWIAEQLVQENLVTQEQLAQCQRIFGHHPSIYPHHLLFRLDSPFHLRFSSQVVLTVAGEVLHRFHISGLCRDDAGGVPLFPWTGSAVARFERSTLLENAGRRVFHIRIVKIIQPAVCTVEGYKGRMVRPEEGHLFAVRPHGGPPEPWAYDIDRKKTNIASALRVLWDKSQTL